MVADIEDSEEMDASELHARRLNAKEVLTPTKGEKSIFPSRRWNRQNFWRRSGFENIHFIPDNPDRGEERGNLRGESDGSSPTPR